MQNTALDLQARPALGSRARLQADPVTGEPVLLYPEGLLQLNDTAHAILARCDGQTTVDDIVMSLAAEYEADADTVRADVLGLLAGFASRGLVVFSA